jgi:hypothetical protein
VYFDPYTVSVALEGEVPFEFMVLAVVLQLVVAVGALAVAIFTKEDE